MLEKCQCARLQKEQLANVSVNKQQKLRKVLGSFGKNSEDKLAVSPLKKNLILCECGQPVRYEDWSGSLNCRDCQSEIGFSTAFPIYQ